MALATNTTLGEIVLGGDLYGTDPAAPSLVPTGITPGSTSNYYNLVIDNKGRSLYYHDYDMTPGTDDYNFVISTLDVNENNPLIWGTTSKLGLVKVGNNIDVVNSIISIPDATDLVKGVVQIGDNINVSSGVISILNASTSVKGVVQVGSGLSSTSGILEFSEVSSTIKGGPIIGDNIDVLDGIISVKEGSSSHKGIVNITPTTGFDILNGVLSFDHTPYIASLSNLGYIKAGTGTTIDNDYLRIDFPVASETIKGIVQIGDNINFSSGVISIPNATDLVKGVVQIGDNINFSSGVISVPDASTSVKGVVQVGSGLISSAGVVSVDTSAFPNASTLVKGVVQIGDNISVSSGVISVPDASSSVFGVAKLKSTTPGLSVINDVLSPILIDNTSTNDYGLVKLPSGLGYLPNDLSAPSIATNSTFGTIKISLTDNYNPPIVNGYIDSCFNVNLGDGEIAIDNAGRNNYSPFDPWFGVVRAPLELENFGFNLVNGVISVNNAESTKRGVVQVGDNIDINAGEISIKTTSTSDFGLVQAGQGFSVGSSFLSLTLATTSVLGAVSISSTGGINLSTDTISITKNDLIKYKSFSTTVDLSSVSFAGIGTKNHYNMLRSSTSFNTFAVNSDISGYPLNSITKVIYKFSDTTATKTNLTYSPSYFPKISEYDKVNNSNPSFWSENSIVEMLVLKFNDGVSDKSFRIDISRSPVFGLNY